MMPELPKITSFKLLLRGDNRDQPNESHLLEDPPWFQENVLGVNNSTISNNFTPCLSFSPPTTTTVHNVQPAPPMHQSGMIAMLQKVLQQQEQMKAQHSVLSKKLAKLEDEIHSSSCSSSPVSKTYKRSYSKYNVHL